MWRKANEKTKLTLELAADPDLSLDAVLSHPDLRDTLRSPSIELMNWIAAQSGVGHLEELLDLALFSSERSCADNYRLARNSVSCLQVEDKSLQSRIFASTIFHAKLAQFMKDEANYRSPIFSAHFARLFHVFMSFTRGGMLARYGSAVDYLVQNIDMMANAELFALLISNYETELLAVKSIRELLLMVVDKLERSEEPTRFFVIMALRMIETSSECQLLQKDVITRLLEVAVRLPDEGVSMRMLFSILERLFSANDIDWKNDLLERCVKEMKFDGSHPTGKMVAAFPVFSAFAIDDMIEYFFSRDDIDDVCLVAFLKRVEEMSAEELDAFVEKHHLVSRIIARPDAFQLGSCNVMIPSLAKFLMNRCGTSAQSFTDNEDWDLFLGVVVMPREMMLRQYAKSVGSVNDFRGEMSGY